MNKTQGGVAMSGILSAPLTARRGIGLLALVVCLLLGACGAGDPVQRQAEAYVRIALSLGQLHEQEVDAWFGPATLAPGSNAATLPELRAETSAIRAALAAETEAAATPRGERLQQKLAELASVLEVIDSQTRIPFVEEAARLYGLTLPETADEVRKEQIKNELESLLPGTGSLAFRVAAFRNRLLVPAEKRRAVFERALAACRERTLSEWTLPAGEELVLEWTRDVSSPWHRYEGNLRSTLQLNDLTLGFIGSALDVACHEGYPGHHAQFVLLETVAGEAGLPVEEQLVLLRTEASVLREAAAEAAVTMAFPPAERLAFEQDVLFPLAGLDAALAEKNLHINRLLAELGSAVIPILRDYRDGVQTFNASTFQLEREALVSSPAQLLEFTDATGAYAVGYTLLRERLEAALMVDGKPRDDAWSLLKGWLEQPDRLPL